MPSKRKVKLTVNQLGYKSRSDKRKKRFRKNSFASYSKFIDLSVDAWSYMDYAVEYCKRKAKQTKKIHEKNISKCKTETCNCKLKYHCLSVICKEATRAGRCLIDRIATEASYLVDYLTLDPSNTDFFDNVVNPTYMKFRRFYAARRRRSR